MTAHALPRVGAFMPPGNLNGEAELDIRHAEALRAYWRARREPQPEGEALWRWFRHMPEGRAFREGIFALETAIAMHGERPRGRR